MRSPASGDEQSDELDASSDPPNDLLAGLSRVGAQGTSAGLNRSLTSHAVSSPTNTNQPGWLSSTSRTSSALLPSVDRPASLTTRGRQPINARDESNVTSFDQPSASSPASAVLGNSQQISGSLFQHPNRSIFTSGQPTSSVSANTAHASMSAPSPGRRPLAALSSPGPSASRRLTVETSPPRIAPSIRLSTTSTGVEKDADDPSAASDEHNTGRRTARPAPMALHQLFVGHSPESPSVSRHGSYLRTLSGTHFTKTSPLQASSLAPHIYGQGLLKGKFSDITVHAFGSSYSLHRLLLDRAPFFSTAFSGPWMESNAKEMTLEHTDVDSNITQAAFELALKRIYGCHDSDEEDQEAISLFAVGNWLEMDDLLEASIASMLKQMEPSKLSRYIQFVTSNYYGRAGDRVLAACKAMLCRDGWQMPIKHWDGIPGDIVREVVGNDGFYVAGEWDRWVLTKRLLNRRLRQVAKQAGLVDSTGKIKKAPRSMSNMAIRFDTIFRQSSPIASRDGSNQGDAWLALYTHADVTQLLVLIDEGIHYVHLSFEQLQKIREQKDALGLPLLPEKVISTSFWMQMELRQKIVNAGETELELGLTQHVEDIDTAILQASVNLALPTEGSDIDESLATSGLSDEISSRTPPDENFLSENAADKRPLEDIEELDEKEDDDLSDSWDSNGKPRKYWIPMSDATFPVGDGFEGHDSRPVRASRATRQTANLFSASVPAEDVHWASDFASLANAANEHHFHDVPHGRQFSTGHQLSNSDPESPTIATVPSPQITYTHLPPFRFSVEFPAARMLKENKRFYSNTLWYAGSLWNVYVQKKDTTKGLQLGVYLHRERQSESNEMLLANYTAGRTVDERIGRLERQMEARQRTDPRASATRDGDTDSTLVNTRTDLDTISGTISQPTRHQSLSQRVSGTPQPQSHPGGLTGSLPLRMFAPYDAEHDSALDDRDRDVDGSESEDGHDLSTQTSSLLSSRRNAGAGIQNPALPPYTDNRPTIKTYFKIFTPSKAGRVLTVYESRPDKFNFSQSWGWKSGSLDIDGDGLDDSRESRDRKLRFMVVVGTV